ncbi:hypothetical protein WM24_27305 [Burkholderia ubonensis]|uniref:tetratricopeptide repeat-containing glycosyltransferase family protein n=1 Tax=Burkholderia ubonensis TaxID=101571 RepID=UPI00075B1A26|nr:tetratricopeptide repeat-containing glycosyltransferase family protein [Burkholderia ubonensis]KWN79231.1 hypothetical protein WM24_27305 [Burkholderia ubonensis]
MSSKKQALVVSAVDTVFAEGVAAHQARLIHDAEGYYRKVLELEPDHAEALNNLGVLLEDSARASEAETCYRRALLIRPGYVDVHCNLGLLLHGAGCLPEAEACYRQAISWKPDCAVAHNKLGLLLQTKGRLLDAERCLREALRSMPDYAEAHANLGVVLYCLERFSDAEGCYREALRLEPDHARVYSNLGVLLHKTERTQEAEICLRKALTLDPGHTDALQNLGSLLYAMQRYDEAETCYRALLTLEPDSVEMLVALGSVLREARRFSESERVLRRAADIEPARLPTTFNLSLVLLTTGRLEEGWRLYEDRYGESPHWGDEAYCRRRPTLPFREWQGESLEGKSMVVWPEQGQGDVIQFARYLPILKARGLSKLTLVCPASLTRMMGWVDGIDECIATNEIDQLPVHDYACLLLSLPLRFGTTLSTIPARMPYVRVPEALSEAWRSRLPTDGFKVGLVWAGDPRPGQASANAIDRRRSLHALAYRPLLEVSGTTFVSLQKGEVTRAQIHEIPEQARPLDLMDEVRDFADTAAIIAGLDLVITVDTSVAHVAGALNKPVWILSRFDSCWRWLADRDDSPWYPSARLFRQTRPGDWTDVLDRVRDELKRLVANSLSVS